MGQQLLPGAKSEENIHDCVQIRHICVMLSVERLFSRWIVSVHLGSQTSVGFGMSEQAVEYAREHAGRRVRASDDS